MLAVYLTAIGLQILGPEILSRFIDETQSGGSLRAAALIILGYLTVSMLQKASKTVINYWSFDLGNRLTNRLRREMLSRFLKCGMKLHDQWSSGEVMTRLDEDVEGYFEYYKILILQLGANSVLLLGVLAVIGLRSPAMGAVLLCISLLTIAVFKKISDFGVQCHKKSSQALAEFNGFMKERVENAVELHLASAEDGAMEEMKTAVRIKFKKCLPAKMMYGRLWIASSVMDLLSEAFVLAGAAVLWSGGVITLGTAYLMYQYVTLIYAPLQSFRNDLGKLQDARAKKIRTEEFMALCQENSEKAGKAAAGKADIVVNDLFFSYEEGKEVLHGISFAIEPGEHIGIVGKTGCGKTTLVKLLAGFYGYQKGSIALAGQEIGEWDEAGFRKRVAYCPQKAQLLHATLRDNITMFDSRYTDGEILDAIAQLGLNPWLAQRKEGLDTVLASAQGSVSSGEAQLIAVIRLFLRNPEVVILDEFTSNLDEKTERALIEAVKRMTEGRTVLLIAHHPAALEQMDRIFVMDGGRIVNIIRRSEG